MSGKGEGRGRGRGRGRGDGKPKNTTLAPELAAKLKDDGKPPTQGQFENSSSDQDSSSLGSSGALNASFSSESNDSPQLKGQPEQNSSSVETAHSTAQSKQDLTSEIKKAAKNVQVVPPDGSPESLTQETTLLHSKQLPQTVPTGTFLSNGYPSPPGRSSSAPSASLSLSKLNPHSTEFIPRPSSSSLNASAAVFVPRFGSAAAPSDEMDSGPQQGNSETLTTSEILDAFEKKCKETSGLLTMAAHMLVDATHFPATFDSHLEIISELVQGKDISHDVQEDLAELLLTWGINNSGLRYTSVKMCDYFCKLPIKDVFRTKLFNKLQKRYAAEKKADHSDPGNLMELSLFMAEMFYRVRIGEKLEPIWILASAIFELMFILLDLQQDQTLICVCNILKLCGMILDRMPKQTRLDSQEKMELVLSTMRSLSVDKNISERTSSVLISVLEKRAMSWDEVEKLSSSKGTTTQVAEETPVTKDSEWSDYMDEKGNVIEGTDEDSGIIFEDQLDPEIDEEMLREYEEFVQEFEDHLLMQEFGIGETNPGTWQ